MEAELSGYVVVAYTTDRSDEEFALTFDAIEFSSQDNESSVDHSSGEPVYRGVWNGSEENVLVQITFTATRAGIRERAWTISAFGDETIRNPRIAEDKITAELVDA